MTLPSLLVTLGGTALGVALGTMLRPSEAAPLPLPGTSAVVPAEAPAPAPAPASDLALLPPGERRKIEAGLARAGALRAAGILPTQHVAAAEAPVADGMQRLRFGQPFVVALTRDGWTDAPVVTTLAVEVSREAAEADGTEAVLRDRITAGLVRASRAGLFDGTVPRPSVTQAVRQVVADALGQTLPRGAEGVVVTDMAKKPVRS